MLLEHFLEKVGPRVPDWQCIRTRTHKYIRYRGLESMDELYDLAADPLELRNLAAQPSSRDTRQQLASELKRLASSTGGRELDF